MKFFGTTLSTERVSAATEDRRLCRSAVPGSKPLATMPHRFVAIVILACFLVGSTTAAGPNSINWVNWDKTNPNRYRTDITYCSPAQIAGTVAGALYTTDQDALRNPSMIQSAFPRISANASPLQLKETLVGRTLTQISMTMPIRCT